MSVLSPALLALTDEAFVSAVYHQLLGRMPDVDGHRNYLGQLAAGADRAAIWAAVAGCDEAQAWKAAQSASAAPRAAEPDPGITARSLHELVALPRDTDFLRSAYLTLLGREPDAEGRRHYTTELAAGLPREELVCSLATSPEGARRALALPGLPALLRARERMAKPMVGAWWTGRAALLRLGLAEAQIAGLRNALQAAEAAREPSQWELVARLDALERRLEAVEHRGIIPDTLAWLASLAATARMTVEAPSGGAPAPSAQWTQEVSRIDRAGRSLHAGIRDIVRRKRAEGGS